LRTLLENAFNSADSLTARRPARNCDLSEEQFLAVALLVEVCRADFEISAVEREKVVELICLYLGLDPIKAEQAFDEAAAHSERTSSLFDYTSQLKQWDEPKRLKCMLALWKVAYADGHLDPHEEALLRQIADLLYIRHSDFVRLKHLAQQQQ